MPIKMAIHRHAGNKSGEQDMCIYAESSTYNKRTTPAAEPALLPQSPAPMLQDAGKFKCKSIDERLNATEDAFRGEIDHD